jgi:hypothetical protein
MSFTCEDLHIVDNSCLVSLSHHIYKWVGGKVPGSNCGIIPHCTLLWIQNAHWGSNMISLLFTCISLAWISIQTSTHAWLTCISLAWISIQTLHPCMATREIEGRCSCYCFPISPIWLLMIYQPQPTPRSEVLSVQYYENPNFGTERGFFVNYNMIVWSLFQPPGVKIYQSDITASKLIHQV